MDTSRDHLRSGDAPALEACYREHGTRVYELCRRMLGSESDAQDAVQEVFLKVFQRASQFAGRARFGTWLHRLTVNHCLNRIESERVRKMEALPDPAHGRQAVDGDFDEGPEMLVEREEEHARLHDQLERLPPEQRAVLVLRELEGSSYREIAEALDIPEGTVMSRLARAREKLWTAYGGASRGALSDSPDEVSR